MNCELVDLDSPGIAISGLSFLSWGFSGDSRPRPVFDEHENPLESDSPQVWDDLIAAVGPASILVVIESRLSSALRGHVSAEDIFQEGLMHAWRDRARCQWKGLKSFRSWLLSIIDNRIRDLADHESAQKRGGGVNHVALAPSGGLLGTESQASTMPGPAASTTPSRVAMYKEQAAAMQVALDDLPPELCDVVRLRLLEQMTLEEIAKHLNIGVAAVRHRFRRGAAIYHRALTHALASRDGRNPDASAPLCAEKSSSDH